MHKVVWVILCLATAAAAYLAYETHDRNTQLRMSLAEQEARNELLEVRFERASVISEVYRLAAHGVLDQVEPEQIGNANQMLDLYIERKPVETAFYQCWDREINTTSWGSMGPWGVLETCIDKIEDDETAKLLFSLEQQSSRLRGECAFKASNRFEEIERCALSGKYRFAAGTYQAFFNLITQSEPQVDHSKFVLRD